MNLQTSYMGLNLSSPIVVSACTLSEKTDNILMMEDNGAGAVVLFSLFEEQIKKEVESKFSHITNKINEFNLYGHSFYLYILPLTELDKNREAIMQGLQS